MDTVTFLNNYSSSFIRFSWMMLLQSSLLILILLGLDLLLRQKVRAVFRYCLWMLVLIKLVLPVGLALPCSPAYYASSLLPEKVVDSPQVLPEIAAPNPVITPADDSIPHQTVLKTPDESVAGAETTAIEPPTVSESAPIQQPPVSLSWQTFLSLGWLIAVLVMLGLLVQRIFFVNSLIRQSKPADKDLLSQLKRCISKMGLRRHVDLRISPNATSPSVCGLIRPVILIPDNLTDQLNTGQMDAILMHELAHIKRGDLWVNLVQALLQILYFYNPLLWVANAVIRRIREQAVDERVLVAMDEQAEEYPQTLLNVSKLVWSKPMLSLRLIGVVESKSALTGRIKHILSRPFPKSAKIGLVGLAVIFMVGACVLPMAKRQESEGSSQEPEEVLRAITDRIKKHPKTSDRDRNFSSNPKIYWEEIGLGIELIINNKVSEDQATDFLQTFDFVGCTYGVEHDGVFRLFGKLNIPRKDIFVNYKLRTLTVDDKSVEYELFEVCPMAVGGSLSWSRETTNKLDPEQSLELQLDVAWYQMPDSMVENLPDKWRDKDEYLKDAVNDTKVKKLCEYTRKLELSKESKWEGIFDRNFPDSKTSNSELPTTNSQNYTATFPNGVTVELLGICEHPSEGKQWWRPDGKELNITSNHSEGITDLLPPGSRPLEFLVNVMCPDGINFEISTIHFECPRSHYKLFEPNIKQAISGNLVACRVSLLTEADTCDIEIGLWTEDWQTKASSGGDEMILGDDREYAFSKPIPKPNGSIGIVLSHDPPEGKLDQRLVAITNDGNVHKSSFEKRTSTAKLEQYQVEFNNVSLDDIKEFRFQTRPFNWIPFKNISLHPGVKTEGEVEIDNGQSTKDETVKENNILTLLLNKDSAKLNGKELESIEAIGVELMTIPDKQHKTLKVIPDQETIDSPDWLKLKVIIYNWAKEYGYKETIFFDNKKNEAKTLINNNELPQNSELKTKNSQYTATLPNGVTVELLGLCEHSSEGKQWWSPDGLPFTLPEGLVIKESSRMVADEKEQKYEFLFKYQFEDEISSSYRIEGSTGIATMSTEIPSGGTGGYEAEMVYFKEAPDSTTVRVSVATGSWQTKFSGFSSKGDIVLPDLLISAPIEENGNLVITTKEHGYNFKYSNHQPRVILKSHKGDIITTNYTSLTHPDAEELQLKSEFKNIKLDEVQEISYQTRSYFPVTFKNISLRPGGETQSSVEKVEMQEGKLEFRIVPDMTPKQAEEISYPKSDLTGFRWFPVENKKDNNQTWTWYKQLPYRKIKGEVYLLLSDKINETMFADGTWGLEDVRVDSDTNGQSAIRITFDSVGAEDFHALTQNNLQRRLAVLVDGKVLSAPQIMTPLSNQAMIAGNFTKKQVEEIVKKLKKGMPPIEMLESAKTPQTDKDLSETIKLTCLADVPNGDTYIDLETDQTFHMRDDLLEKQDGWDILAWLKKKGVDLAVRVKEDTCYIGHVGSFTWQVPNESWETITSEEIKKNPELIKGNLGHGNITKKRKDLPRTYLFKTSQAGLGILQITGFTDEPKGVNIRYKLVQQNISLRPGGKREGEEKNRPQTLEEKIYLKNK